MKRGFFSQLYALYKRSRKRLKYVSFLDSPSDMLTDDVLSVKDDRSVDIITIAFNNAKTIEYQIKLIRKNLADSHIHIIADNSTDFKIKQSIFDLCKGLNVPYVSIPAHIYTRNESHAAAMHWVYKNVVKKRNNLYFGFIDHDIYPLQQCSIISKVKNGIYGRVTPAYGAHETSVDVSENQPYWSLWAGFFFLETRLLANIGVYEIDFSPKYTDTGLYLDTGGGLWDTVISKIPFPGEMAKYSNVRFRESVAR